MSSLGLSILILAVSAIVAVVAVNLAQALGRRRRLSASRPKAEGEGASRSRSDAADGPSASGSVGGQSSARSAASARGPRREPRLGEAPPPAAVEPSFSMRADENPLAGPDDLRGPASGAFEVAGAQVEPSVREGAAAVGPSSSGAGFPGAAPRAVAGGPLLSALCDCIVTLPLEAPVAGERLIALTQGVRRAGAKPILFEGVPVGAADDDGSPLTAGVACRALRIGVLLANRHGPLNAMEYSEFVAAVQSVADQLATLADTPDMADVIARARDLDATCAQLDAQIGLNVDSPEPLGPAQVAALAAELGLADRGGHRHARLGPAGELVFTMSLTDSPQRLAFLLDVPRTAASLDGWAAMLDCAQEAASRLSGRLVDDAGRPIPLESLGTIGRQLAQRYESLDAIGFPAGSPLALRVFN